jgi:ADP-heptose:LPS heptosyltransferase
VRLSHLGDVVHALPVFHALRASFPLAEIGWAVEREFAGLLEGLPGLARLVVLDRGGGLAAWKRFAAELRRFAPGWAVDAQGNAKSALASLLSGAARRSGLHARDWQEPWAALAASERALQAGGGRPRERVHALERALELMASATARAWQSNELCFDLGLGPAERVRGAAILAERWPECGARAGRSSWILLLGTGDDPRAWPLPRWADLARALHARGAQVLVLGGPTEREAGLLLERELGPLCRHWVGQRGLRELAAALSAAAERGARALGVDSGPLHLAAACGLPVVVLEGPQSHERTGPWPVAGRSGSPHAVVRASNRVDCAPCLARTCRHPMGPVCMEELTVEEALRGIERMEGPAASAALASAVHMR